jgi:hypothetical protein
VRPCLLLIPAFTELQWTIREQLEEWAEVASFDAPGVGGEPLPDGLRLAPDLPDDELAAGLDDWRQAAVERGIEEVGRRGWESFFVVADGHAIPTGLRIASECAENVRGLALGHAALSRSMDGERPALNREIWSAMSTMLRTDRESFIRHAIAQVTGGSVTESTATQMVERFPNSQLAVAVWDAMGADPEPIEDDLRALNLPMLLGQHLGCLGSTDEGFHDIVARFPEAATVSCPDACSNSPDFANALREFCASAP